MATASCARQLRHLRITPGLQHCRGGTCKPIRPVRDAGHHILKPSTARSMATISETPAEVLVDDSKHFQNKWESSDGLEISVEPDESAAASQPPHTVLTTIYDFPRMEPLRFAYYPTTHLFLPLRKDILHRAIVYEGDMTRQGTASTKWRSEVHGSHHKLRQQKGSGKARVGDKQSPTRVGGGVAFGPKPRDFASKLQRKVYDLAWRTALSFRFRRGELVLVDRMRNFRTSAPYFTKQAMERNGWGNADGRSMLVVRDVTPLNKNLFKSFERAGEEGRILTTDEVDVKNLLETGRVIIEVEALNELLHAHTSDLVAPFVAGAADAAQTTDKIIT